LRFDETEYRVCRDRRFDCVTAFFQYLDCGGNGMRIGGSYNRAPVPASTGPSGSASRRRVCILLWRIKRRAPGDQDYGQKYAGESRVSHPIIVFGSNKDGQYTAFRSDSLAFALHCLPLELSIYRETKTCASTPSLSVTTRLTT
jgi:hypothetical protein